MSHIIQEFFSNSRQNHSQGQHLRLSQSGNRMLQVLVTIFWVIANTFSHFYLYPGQPPIFYKMIQPFLDNSSRFLNLKGLDPFLIQDKEDNSSFK